MRNKNMSRILQALLEASIPIKASQLNLFITGMHERTLRRGLTTLQAEELIEQTKGGRGYKQGVAITITKVSRQGLKRLQKDVDRRMATKAKKD